MQQGFVFWCEEGVYKIMNIVPLFQVLNQVVSDEPHVRNPSTLPAVRGWERKVETCEALSVVVFGIWSGRTLVYICHQELYVMVGGEDHPPPEV